MCGIAGVFGRPAEATVDRMLSRLRHRGPDDDFLVTRAECTLGVRRLSIVDVDGGRQPLANESGTVWAAQNGEIYNFAALRRELEAKGHRFQTRTDTEVIPHLYEDWGAAFPRHLNGMFAVAIWDDARRSGVLARDPVGKKPLYLLERAGCLYFASEIKALLAVPDFERRIDAAAIHHFLSYKHVPEPATAFVGIRALRPGEVLTWNADDGARIESYWAFSWHPDPAWDRTPEEEIVRRLEQSLRESVQRRLMSDVPIGFYLSGGVDSSLSTAIAATLSRERIRTFTLTYDGPSSTPGKEEDRRWAKVVAERYDTDHYEERLSAESFTDGFRRILQQFDQPFAGVVSPYFLARAMARHVKVALSGDGADELFGSYLSHRLAPAIAAYLDGGRPALDLPWWTPIRDQAERIAHRDPARWRAQLHVFSETDKRSLYTAQFAEMVGGASSEEHLAGYFDGGTARDPLNAMLEAEFRGIFPDQVLAFVDRLSMAHSLETRCPFLDRDFVQLAASLPDRLKTRDGETKWILKRLALRYLPEKLVHRPKEGFVMPVNEWLRGALDAFTKEALVPERVRRAGFVQPTAVAALVERFRGGEVALANQVLSLIALHVWWEDYFGDVRTY